MWNIFSFFSSSQPQHQPGIKKLLTIGGITQPKQTQIEILPSFSLLDILTTFSSTITPILPKEDQLLSPKQLLNNYNFILKQLNTDTQFILPLNFTIYDFLSKNPTYEIYFIKSIETSPFNADYNSNSNNDIILPFIKNITFIQDDISKRVKLLEQKNLLKYSKKHITFIKVHLILMSDYIEIITPNKNKHTKIKISSITNISQSKEIIYKDGNHTFFTLYFETTSPNKRIYIIINDFKSFNEWLYKIKTQMTMYDMFNKSNSCTITTYSSSKNINEVHSRLMKGLYSNLESVLMFKHSRKVLLSYLEHIKPIKCVVDCIFRYKENVNKGNYFLAYMDIEELSKEIEGANTEYLGLDAEFFKWIGNLKMECKKIVSDVQLGEGKGTGSAGKMKIIDGNLQKVLKKEMFDNIYYVIKEKYLNDVYKKECEKEGNEFMERINWCLCEMQSEMDGFYIKEDVIKYCENLSSYILKYNPEKIN